MRYSRQCTQQLLRISALVVVFHSEHAAGQTAVDLERLYRDHEAIERSLRSSACTISEFIDESPISQGRLTISGQSIRSEKHYLPPEMNVVTCRTRNHIFQLKKRQSHADYKLENLWPLEGDVIRGTDRTVEVRFDLHSTLFAHIRVSDKSLKETVESERLQLRSREELGRTKRVKYEFVGAPESAFVKIAVVVNSSFDGAIEEKVIFGDNERTKKKFPKGQEKTQFRTRVELGRVGGSVYPRRVETVYAPHWDKLPEGKNRSIRIVEDFRECTTDQKEFRPSFYGFPDSILEESKAHGGLLRRWWLVAALAGAAIALFFAGNRLLARRNAAP